MCIFTRIASASSRSFLSVLGFLLTVAVGPCLHAAGYSQEESGWLVDNKMVRAGFAVRHPPYGMANDAGEPIGIDVDVFRRLASQIKLQFLAKHSGSGSEAAADVDILVGVESTPELAEAFLFTKPYLRLPMAIIARQDSVFFLMEAKLKGKRVGVTGGSSPAVAAVGATPVVFDTLEKALRALGKGKVDLVVDDPLEAGVAIQSQKITGVKIVGSLEQPYELRIAVRKDWPALVSILNGAIDGVSGLEKQTLCDTWAPAKAVPAFGMGLNWIILVVGVSVCGLSVWYVLNRRQKHSQHQSERSRLRRELARVNERATSLHGEKARILQLASSDVFHPLADIRAHATRLAGTALSAEAIRASGDDILVQTTRIQKALDALREIQSLDADTQSIHVTTVNVGAVVAEALAHLEEAAAKRRVRLSIPAAGQTALVLADVDVLRKVLESLLVGSIKVAPQDSTVSVAFWTVEDRVLISVSDEGPGVSVADEMKVFGSYHQLGATLIGAENATGYGFALVEKLVKAMEACLWYESTPGEGATYVIELPIVKGKGAAAPRG